VLKLVCKVWQVSLVVRSCGWKFGVLRPVDAAFGEIGGDNVWWCN